MCHLGAIVGQNGERQKNGKKLILLVVRVLVVLLLVLLVTDVDGFFRRRRRKKKGKEQKAPVAKETKGVCVQAIGTPSLVDNPDPKAGKTLGQAAAGEVFEQSHDVGGGFIIVKNSRGGGYTKAAEWKTIPCPAAGAAAPAAAAPVAPAPGSAAAADAAAASGVAPAADASGSQAAPPQDPDARATDTCVSPANAVDIRGLPEQSGELLGHAEPGEQWKQVLVLANGWVKVESPTRGKGFTQVSGWALCEGAEASPPESGVLTAGADTDTASPSGAGDSVQERANAEASGDLGPENGWGEQGAPAAAVAAASPSAVAPRVQPGAAAAGERKKNKKKRGRGGRKKGRGKKRKAQEP